MKKIFLFLIMLIIPTFVFAKEYEVGDINLKLNVKDQFIVLSRDNIKGNEDLARIGLSEEYMTNAMYASSIYLDIIDNSLSYEVVVVVPSVDITINNFSNVTDDILEDTREYLKKKVNADKSSIYKGKYNYVVVDYYDSINNYYIVDYYTVVNAKGYNFQLQKKSPITDEERNNLKEIVDSVNIKVLDEYKNESDKVQKEIDNYGKSKFNWKRIIIGTIVGAVIGGLGSIIALFFKKRKSKSNSIEQ